MAELVMTDIPPAALGITGQAMTKQWTGHGSLDTLNIECKRHVFNRTHVAHVTEYFDKLALVAPVLCKAVAASFA
jgi:hypothetical protein